MDTNKHPMKPAHVLLDRQRVVSSFERHPARVFPRRDVIELIRQELDGWVVDHAEASSPNDPNLIEAPGRAPTHVLRSILDATQLDEERLDFAHRPCVRYVWGEAPVVEVAQSLDDEGYFTHFAAMQIHGLTDQIPKTVYFNVEQQLSGGGGTLTQEGINRAFKGRCRVSNNTATYRRVKICKVNGMNTGRLGVVEFKPDDCLTELRVTNLERTLIDATVRPVYCGGVQQVSKAFHLAAAEVSVNRLAAYLRKLHHTYPYHQAIGFYLQRAGNYDPSQIDIFRQFPIEFDFYLTYGMKDPQYDAQWRLFFPQGF